MAEDCIASSINSCNVGIFDEKRQTFLAVCVV